MTNRLHLLKQPYRDIAERWVAALRSGEYRQGEGRLYRLGYYCCLGVLQGPILGDENLGVECGLMDDAMEASGLRTDSGMFMNNGKWCHITNVNDCGTPFPHIADLIESVPVGLWRDECFESGRQPEDNSDEA